MILKNLTQILYIHNLNVERRFLGMSKIFITEEGTK